MTAGFLYHQQYDSSIFGGPSDPQCSSMIWAMAGTMISWLHDITLPKTNIAVENWMVGRWHVLFGVFFRCELAVSFAGGYTFRAPASRAGKFYIPSSHLIPCGSTTWIWVDYLDVNGPRYVGKWEANSMHGWGRLVHVSIVCWPGAWPNTRCFHHFLSLLVVFSKM